MNMPWRLHTIRHREYRRSPADGRVTEVAMRVLKVRGRAGARGLSQGEDEDFYDAVCIAATRLVCRPGNARNAVAIAAISANRQADKKT